MNNKMNFIILIGICLFMLINPNNCWSINAIHNDDLVRSSFSVIEPCQFENDIDSITVLYWNAWVDSEGKEHYVQGETIVRAYPALEKGRGYGKCFVSFKIHIPIDTYNLDTSNVAPEQLAYNCKGQLVLKFNKKKTYSGTVSGDIVCPYVVHPERIKKFPKSYIRFYNRFASCHYLFGIATSLEKDMSQFVYSHVFVNGFIDYGKETGEWQFRYTYEDTDFLFMTANYKNGKLEGTVKFYKPDGRLYQEAEFEKGKLVLRIWYNEEGEIIYKDYYKNDKLIRTEQYAKDPRSF